MPNRYFVTERVWFKLIKMPCCGHLFCNINPRLPTYCPECGTQVFTQVKKAVLISDSNAELRYLAQ